MKTNVVKSGVLSLALGAGLATAASAQLAPQIYLNGQPLRTSVAPVQQNGRTLVPMRDIFEALGAQVDYNSLNQTIVAQQGNTSVRMALGSREAMVNNARIMLDVPAQAYYGRTLVPLRFVSEAMGANVDYNPVQNIVAINGTGLTGGSRYAGGGRWNGGPGFWNGRNGRNGRNGTGRWNGGSQVGGFRQLTIPTDSVIPVTLDQRLSSATAYAGQTFTATVISSQPGDSEFPAGTRIEGIVQDVQRRTSDNPGVLGLSFRTAVLPDGSRVPFTGQLTSLDSDSVSNTGGRLMATGGRSNDTLKVVGIGAAGGYLIGRLLKRNGLVSALIGAAGGYLYDRTRDRNQFREANLQAGTRLGVRVTQPVNYRDTSGYYDRRSNYVPF